MMKTVRHSVLEKHLPEGAADRTTVCAGELPRGLCPTGK